MTLLLWNYNKKTAAFLYLKCGSLFYVQTRTESGGEGHSPARLYWVKQYVTI